jgi:hypothetical protein
MPCVSFPHRFSVSLAGTYQSRALRVVNGLTNQRSLTSSVFLDYPGMALDVRLSGSPPRAAARARSAGFDSGG